MPTSPFNKIHSNQPMDQPTDTYTIHCNGNGKCGPTNGRRNGHSKPRHERVLQTNKQTIKFCSLLSGLNTVRFGACFCKMTAPAHKLVIGMMMCSPGAISSKTPLNYGLRRRAHKNSPRGRMRDAMGGRLRIWKNKKTKKRNHHG